MQFSVIIIMFKLIGANKQFIDKDFKNWWRRKVLNLQRHKFRLHLQYENSCKVITEQSKYKQISFNFS